MANKRAGRRSKRAAQRPRAKAVVAETALARPEAEAIGDVRTENKAKAKPVRDIQKHAVIEVRRAFPEICGGLIEKAKGGAMGQTKLLMKISGLDENPRQGGKRRGKTLSAMLIAELEKAKKEREAMGGEVSEPSSQAQ